MDIKYNFSSEEIELIKELKKIGNSYSYAGSFDAFRDKYQAEISTFIDYGFLYHSNSGSEGAYIRYSVSNKGLTAFEQAVC